VVLVGRSPGCGVRLPGPGVSTHHCSLVRTPLGLWVVDLLGLGIRVNGAAVRCARLGDRDELRVGHVLIRPRYGTAAAGPGTRRPGTSARGVTPPRPRPMVPEGPPERGGGPGAPAPLPPAPSASTPELIAWPVAPEPPDRAAVLLSPLIDQFGQMQQQMFDQFHQALLMMFQMFGTLHRDQMEQVRAELDRVGRLTRELQELKAEAAAAAPGRSTPAPAPRPGNGTRGTVAAAPAPPADPAPAGGPTGRPPGPHAYEQVHAHLHRRIVALQHERQDRWQKILAVLRGRPREEPAP